MAETCSVILYIKGIEELLLQSDRFYKLFKKMLEKLSGSVLILGSHMSDINDEDEEMDERMSLLFPHMIEVEQPDDKTDLVNWETQLEKDKKLIQCQENKIYISEVLAANDIDCNDLDSICEAHSEILSDYTEAIVISAISHHLMNNKNPEYRNGKLVISSERYYNCFYAYVFFASLLFFFDTMFHITILVALVQFVPWIEFVPGRKDKW